MAGVRPLSWLVWTLGRGGFELDARDVAPQILEAVVRAELGREDVEHDVEVVADDPRRLALAVGRPRERPRPPASAGRAPRPRSTSPGAGFGRSRRRRSRCRCRPAACRGSRRLPPACPGRCRRSGGPVRESSSALSLPRVGRGTTPADRSRRRRPPARARRSGRPSRRRLRISLDETGTGSRSKNRTRSGRSSCASTRSSSSRAIAGTRGDAEAHVVEDLVGRAPGEEVRELIGADEEDRVVAVARDRVDRVRVLVAHDVVVREREPREAEARVHRRRDRLVGRVGRHEHAQGIEVEMLASPSRASRT